MQVAQHVMVPMRAKRVISPPVAAVRVKRWLGLFSPRNLCLMAGGVALIYIAATVMSYAQALGSDQVVTGGGVIGGDYAAFYAAGRLVLNGQISQLYDSDAVRAVQQAAINVRVPDFYVAYRNPPFFAVALALFASVDLLTSFAMWSVASAALLILAVALALRTQPQLRRHWKLIVLAIAGFCPVYSGLVDGQNAAMSLLLYVLVYLALREGRDAQAGALAALGLFKPQLFFLLPVVFAASRRWRALFVYSGAASALALVSLILVGPEGAIAWTRIIIGFEPANAAKLAGRMYSLKAFFDVLLPEQTSVAFGLSLICSLFVIALVIRVWRLPAAQHRDVALRWVFTMLAALLVDPHLVDYDLTVLVLPGLLILGTLSEAPWWIVGLSVLTAIDLPLTLGPVSLQLGVVLLVVLALRVCWRLERGQHVRLLAHTPVLVDIAHHGGARAV
jgi:hypothetical protein